MAVCSALFFIPLFLRSIHRTCIENECLHKPYTLCSYKFTSPFILREKAEFPNPPPPTKVHALTSPQVQGSVTNPLFNFPGGRQLTFDEPCHVPGIRRIMSLNLLINPTKQVLWLASLNRYNSQFYAFTLRDRLYSSPVLSIVWISSVSGTLVKCDPEANRPLNKSSRVNVGPTLPCSAYIIHPTLSPLWGILSSPIITRRKVRAVQ